MKSFSNRMLLFFLRLFSKKPEADDSVMIPWEKAVEMMYDKQKDYLSQLIKVIYSKDKSMRYVILKDNRGLFTYDLETLYPYEENDYVWQ